MGFGERFQMDRADPFYYLHSGDGGGGSSSQQHQQFGLHVMGPPPDNRIIHDPSSAMQDTSSSASMPVLSNVAGSSGAEAPVKRKRGRPRKYNTNAASIVSAANNGSSNNESRLSSASKPRGRPPGSGKKQQMALMGKWFSDSAGSAFTSHVIQIAAGEDIASKIRSFSRQGSISICILSASGVVSSVTLSHPDSSGRSVTYKGHYQILSLSCSSLLNYDEDGSSIRTRGFSITLSNPDDHVFGGSVTGCLIAASPVEVVIGSFNNSGSNAKAKSRSSQGSKLAEDQDRQGQDGYGSMSLAPPTLSTSQSLNPATSQSLNPATSQSLNPATSQSLNPAISQWPNPATSQWPNSRQFDMSKY